MKLSLLLGPETDRPAGAAAVDLAGLTPDSREVRPGWLFAALPGSKDNGARFVPAALAAGAAAVLVGERTPVPADAGVPVIRSADPRLALALMAARFYRAQPDVIVGITGTSGKTTTAFFTRQIWQGLGEKAANLGTLGLIRPDGSKTESLTTPEPVTLHKMLAGLAQEGVTHLAMEASSHGLDQRRLDGVRLAAGAFLNIGRDHLDYHPTPEAYFEAKLRLFSAVLPEGAAAVVNADAERSEAVVEAAYRRNLRVLTVGAKGQGIRLERLERDGFGQRLTLRHEGERISLRLPLVGDYVASNALVAAGLAIATGSPPDGVFAGLEKLQGVVGRLEIVAEAKGGIVVVDYAHKPDALAAALAALKPFATGRLICLFGCGGDRDRGKRPIMGGIAVRQADVTVVTDDNPRSESPAAIRAEILAGAPGAREIGERGEAIAWAVGEMGPGDVVLVAGKGHETGQIVGDRTLPFSDHEAVRAALAGLPSHG